MRMVFFKCHNPQCEAVFGLDWETVTVIEDVSCSGCSQTDCEEIHTTDVEVPAS